MQLRNLSSIALMLSITLAGASAGIAGAQQPSSAPSAQNASAASSAQNAQQDPNGQNPDTHLTSNETITVTAPGETRDVQTVDMKALIEAAPGASPISVLARLPSVEVTTADPYGAYEWALRISVRGFNQNQLGFTLDEVPLGDMSYGNLNGLHISRAIIDEDMGHISLSQGTGGLEVASTSNLGGAVQFFSSDPLDKLHFDARQSFGSFDASRTYARFDSGELATHTRFYVAGAWQRADKWKSEGERNQRYEQFNFKLTQPIGSSGMITAYADISNRQEVDYQDLDKIWVQTLGYNWDNFGNWNTALQAAYACDGVPGVSYPSPVNKLASNQDQCDAGYYGASGLRKDALAYVSYKMTLGSHILWKTTAYGHGNQGDGLWFTPYLPTYDNTGAVVSPISLRTSEYGIKRGGFVTSLTYEDAHNSVEGGAWFEKETFDLARRFYGTTLASPSHSLYDFPTAPFYTQWQYEFPSTIYQLHLQDHYKITPKITVAAGFKSVETNQTGNLKAYNTGLDLAPTEKAASFAQGSLESGSAFLPQVGVDWKLNDKSEVFADVAKNVRSFQTGGNGFGTSPWGTTQAGFDALTNNLKPESAWSEEAGYRYTGKTTAAQANFFHVNYSNRLLAIQQGSAIAGAASLLSNVGGVTTNGVDGAVSVRFANGWTLYNGLTFSRSTYNDNYDVYDASAPNDTDTILTGGKVAVDSPEFMWKNELSYSHSGFDAHIDSDYMSKRYYTYTDDSSVDGRFLADAGVSYHKDQIGIFDQLKLQFNIYNLANAKYYSTVGTNGFIASDPTGVGNNTLQEGAPRALSGTFSMRF